MIRRTLYQIHTEPVSTLKETVTESRWHQPFSEPRRSKPPFSAGRQQFLAFSPTEIITVSKWFRELDAPIRRPVRRLEGTAFFVPVVTTSAEVITVDKWLQPFGTPLPTRRLPASEQQALAYTRDIALADWFQPLAAPLARPRRVLTQEGLYVPITAPLSWQGFFSIPMWITTTFYQVRAEPIPFTIPSWAGLDFGWGAPTRPRVSQIPGTAQPGSLEPITPVPPVSGVYTVSGLYVIDQFTDNTVVYDYSGGVSHRTN